MRHRDGGRKLGLPTDRRLGLIKNLAVSLILYEKITITEARAKTVQPYVEKLITLAKRGDLHARRLVLARLGNANATAKLFADLAGRYTDRTGGYTQLFHLPPRPGDGAPMVVLQLVP